MTINKVKTSIVFMGTPSFVWTRGRIENRIRLSYLITGLS